MRNPDATRRPVAEEPAPESAGARLRAALAAASHLSSALDSHLASARARAAAAEARAAAAEARLAEVEADDQELAARLVAAEHQVDVMMNLYVATYRLHATLDPAEVKATIAEIAINLLGAERFVLLLRREGSDDCEVAMAEGLEDAGPAALLYAGGRYSGGDPMVDGTLADGTLRLGPAEGSDALAAVPLMVHDAVVGALVVLKLLGHKGVLTRDDRSLLDLMAAHAASALFAARLYATADRKLRTLESLVKLVRGG